MNRKIYTQDLIDINLLENTKNIQAAIGDAAFNAAKLNFPMLIANVFSTVRIKSRKFSKSFFNTK